MDKLDKSPLKNTLIYSILILLILLLVSTLLLITEANRRATAHFLPPCEVVSYSGCF